MSRIKELQARLSFKGARQKPKRKTWRRWNISAAVVSLRFTALRRDLNAEARLSERACGWPCRRGEARAELFQLLDAAANARRAAFAYPRNSYIKPLS